MQISFYLNRDFISADVDGNQSALDFLRKQRGLTGAKEACNEGDCGACIIVLGETSGGDVQYRAVNSCLIPAPRLHGRHVVTIEGLAEPPHLHLIQQAMLEQHAIQCGFCTSGIVMTLFGLFQQNASPSREQIISALDGSLCRCTGYASIVAAAESVARRNPAADHSSAALRPSYFAGIADQLQANLHDSSRNNSALTADGRYHTPASLADYFALEQNFRDTDRVLLLNGGTDLMVAVNDGQLRPDQIVDLERIREFTKIDATESQVIIGARATLSDVLGHPLIKSRFAALYSAVAQMCSTPVRNSATLVGNICTASPIADTIPVLMVLQAQLVIASRGGVRRIPLRDFIAAYRKTDLRRGEILLAVELPFSDLLCSFEKTGKRKVQDIATVNSAIAVQLSGGVIADCSLVYGGVAAVPFRAERTERYLIGNCVSPHIVEEASQLAADEISPLDDVRGSAHFRRRLTSNHLWKHFTRLFPDMFES